MEHPQDTRLAGRVRRQRGVPGMDQFLSLAHGMSVIERWNNKPNLLAETVAAHSFLVSVMAWGLGAAAQAQGMTVDLDQVLKRAIAHDLHEVVTGDILAPTKRADPGIAQAVAELEREANLEILATLPPPLQEALAPYMLEPTDETTEGQVVAAADLLAAYMKSWLEVQLGNAFHVETRQRISGMLQASPLPMVAELMADLERLEQQGDGVEDEQSLAAFLHHLVTLYYVKRWNYLPSLAPKSVAAHSHLVALAAWVMAAAENHAHGRDLPMDAILKRALLVEAPKAITGDILYRSKTASRPMAAGVEAVRAQAAQQMIATLPPALQPHFAPYMAPLPGAAGKLVEEAAVVAAYMEVLMEVRLGNSYFIPLRQALEERLADPFSVTKDLMAALGRIDAP